MKGRPIQCGTTLSLILHNSNMEFILPIPIILKQTKRAVSTFYALRGSEEYRDYKNSEYA